MTTINLLFGIQTARAALGKICGPILNIIIHLRWGKLYIYLFQLSPTLFDEVQINVFFHQ